MSRTKNSVKNITFSLAGQTLAILVSFFARRIFLSFLSIDYLGVNSVFSSILTMLSLFELGIGPAIIFSLYRPLEQNDTGLIMALMNFYKKSYRIIGIIILSVGVALTPILGFIVGELPDIPYINFIYILFVINTGLSYFYAYKRSLIIADQKQYITVLYHYAVNIVMNIIQIITLYLTRDYILFLVIQLLATLIENLMIARKANQLYPVLKVKNSERIDSVTRKEISRNVKAMIIHRIGGIAVNATDNILISRMINFASVGIYSNYLLVIGVLNAILYQFFFSISASVGNLGTNSDDQKSNKMFFNIYFFNFWVYSFSSICFFYLINPVISTIWLGNVDYIFSYWIVLLISINYYISGMRQSVLTFKEAFGLNWHDWYKPLLEAIVNLVASIILGRVLGLAGILIGTLLTRILVTLWIEPVVLFRYGFNAKPNLFYKRFFLYLMITAGLWSVTGLAISAIPYTGFLGLGFSFFICLIIPNAFLYIFFRKSAEFKYLSMTVKETLFEFKSKMSSRDD